MRIIATGMSLAGSGTGCMTTKHKQNGQLCNPRQQVAIICPQVSSEDHTGFHECIDKSKLSSAEDKSYSPSLHPVANEWLSFWLFLVASSYFLLSKQVNYFSSCRAKPEEKVPSSNRSIPNETTENDATASNDMLSLSESSESPHRTSSSMNNCSRLCTESEFDVYSEISDMDRASYWHSLLSLEEEDSEWLSDSMTYECSSENPSSPLSFNCDSFTDISDIGTPSYWDSLLKLDQREDSKWISESTESPHRTSSMSNWTGIRTESECDVYSKISDLDRASYWHSLLSLEEEDSEWLSDSITYECSSENPSSPLSYNCDSFTDVSDIDTPSYWDSLLRLDQREDSKWISKSSESPHRTSSSMNSRSRLCTESECDVYSEISNLDRVSYWHSLLSLEEEDSEWLSDSLTCECSPENPSSPLSYSCESFTDISDIDTPSYWDSLLRLDQREDSEWISDSKHELEYEGSCIWGIDVLPSEDNISMELLLETADIEELSADEPLFWPFEGKFNWNSEESSFCTSPRKRLVFDSETSRLSTWSKSSAKTLALGCKDDKAVLKRGEVQSNKLLSLSKTFLNEDFDSNMDFPLGREYFAFDQEFPIETLVGLKEFDGHEGLDSEFIIDVFMLVESLE